MEKTFHHPNRVVPFNIAEAIIDPFFHAADSVIDRYRYEGIDGERNRIYQNFCRIELSFAVSERTNPTGGKIGSMHRECRIDASDYDHFVIRANVSQDLEVIVRLTVDGIPQEVVRFRGEEQITREYSGPFTGNVIEEIEISIHAHSSGFMTAAFEWTGLFDERRRALLVYEKPTYDTNWTGYLREDVTPEDLVPAAGIFFGADELDSIRRKSRLPEYRHIMEKLREQARSYGELSLEEAITFSARTHSWFNRDEYTYDSKGRQRPALSVGCRIVAFVALVDRDVELGRLAARMMLALAHIPVWDSFVETLPDFFWEDRGFPGANSAIGCVYALDWVGNFLTERGRAVVADALASKALPKIPHSLMKWEYMWHGNQGIYVTYVWILVQIALESIWPRSTMLLDRSVEMLIEMTRYAIGEHGVQFEGLNYLFHTLNMSLYGLYVYSRFRKRPIMEFVDERWSELPEFILSFVSEGDYPGGPVPIGDGGCVGWFFGQSAATMAYRLFGDERMTPYLKQIYRYPFNEESMDNGNGAIVAFGPEHFSDGSIQTPVFRLWPDSGYLTSSRRTEYGSVRLVLCGAPPLHVDHNHEDRGQFILEAFGRTLFNEAGMVLYDDPFSAQGKRCRFHNVCSPGGLDEEPRQQVNGDGRGCPVSGFGDEVRLSGAVEYTAVYDEGVSLARRRVESESPFSISVIDELVLDAIRPATFRLNSVVPFEKTSEGWRIVAGNVEAIVRPGWDVVRSRTSENGHNYRRETVYLLELEAPESSRHHLETEISVRRLGE